jgi:hypothetical protein
MIAVERAAGEAFRDIGMVEIADDPPATVEQLAEFLESGTAWVAADEQGFGGLSLTTFTHVPWNAPYLLEARLHCAPVARMDRWPSTTVVCR